MKAALSPFSVQGPLFQLIVEALDFIESRLKEPTSVQDVTQRFEQTHWQFQRLFSSVVGVPIGQYLRERRLTESAQMLQESKTRVLDIALVFCFGSEEAFIRSFKSHFGLNPGQYRKSQGLVLREARNRITSEKLQFFWENVHRIPEVVTYEAQTLVGMSIEFKSHFILGADCHKNVVGHWSEFKKHMDIVPNRVGQERVGVILTSELDLREERLTYFCGVPVRHAEDLLPGMHSVFLPAGTYACFENKTLSDKIGHLIDYIYGIWLPSSNYERALGFDFEIFDHRYGAQDPTSMSRFFVPVSLKT